MKRFIRLLGIFVLGFPWSFAALFAFQATSTKAETTQTQLPPDITLQFTAGDINVLPATPPIALAVYDANNKLLDFEFVDYGDPIPPYLTMYLKLTQHEVPVVKYDPQSDIGWYYQSPVVRYVRVDQYLPLIGQETVLEEQRDTPLNPAPDKEPVEWPKQVAILPCTLQEWMDKIRGNNAPDDREAARRPEPRIPTPGLQNAHRRHNMTLGA
jgi:hypothetical protein